MKANQAVHLTPRTSAALAGKVGGGASDLCRYKISMNLGETYG